MSVLSAIETAALVRSGELSAVEVTRAALDRVHEGNGRLNAFVHLDAELAIATAETVDALMRDGNDPGPLAGVPFGVKDNLACAGMPTCHGSLVYKGRAAEASDAPLVARLRAAGAVPIGKTALPEFAMDSATHSPGWGVTRNPWNPRLTPGGSSGGSAAAVSAGMVPFATGSDLGGSIRSPAAFTGLVGLMPTHGRIPYAPPVDFDVLGVLTRTAADTARILDITAGADVCDRHSLLPALGSCEELLETLDCSGLRACWSADLGFAVVEREVAEIAASAARDLCEAVGIELVETRFAPPNPYTTWIEIEAFAMAARLEADRIYPGKADQLAELSLAVIEQMAPDRVTWMRACQRREEIVAQTAALFADVDLLLTPAVSCTAFPAEGPIPEEIEGRDASESGAEPFTMLANMTWQPAISIPAGLSTDGLPVGLQVMGRHLEEKLLLRLARIMETVRPWPQLAPR